MNPVEIEEAVSNLALAPFDAAEFPFQFLIAFDNPATTIKRLRTGSTNQSDVPGGVLQRNNIHIATCAPGAVDDTLKALRDSPKTAAAKAKFIVATDGEWFHAEDMNGGGTVACSYAEFSDHFGFFLPLAGITTVKEIRESSFDVKATGRLNRLYVQLLKDNPDWASLERQHDMNHFMARLIFCFFAEDTDIFLTEGLFTKTVEQMSAGDAGAIHEVIGEIFRAMDTKPADRDAAGLARYATKFPYVNGQLFSGSTDAPRFSRTARSFLLRIGSLNWRKINPDIFGSMIQAVTDEDERGSLGMHYTSVPNILKVLNPLFLDDLRDKLCEAGDSSQKLLNLRKRMARIRVFDPACGSGNFLVIAYKEMREIEAEINRRRGEADRRSDISVKNFRGIEFRDFPAEIARLALIIAEYQADVIWRGQKEAVADFLPLGSENWIIRGDALLLDWLDICPPNGVAVRIKSSGLFETPSEQSEVDFDNDGGETYICGNPPYLGSKKQTDEQKSALGEVLSSRIRNWKSLDYVSGWMIKASEYAKSTQTTFAFVTTNSICQGQHVPILWPHIFGAGMEIVFAHTSFKWSNLARNKAGVTVVIVGVSNISGQTKKLFSQDVLSGDTSQKIADNINAYLVNFDNIEVSQSSKPLQGLVPMQFGNHPYYGAALIFDQAQRRIMSIEDSGVGKFIRPFYGSSELIDGTPRACLWITDVEVNDALRHPQIAERVEAVRIARTAAGNGEISEKAKKAGKTGAKKEDVSARKLAATPWKFREQLTAKSATIIVPRVSSENRPYLPVGLLTPNDIVQEKAFALYDAPLWTLAIVASRMHWVWIGTICVRMRTDFSYSNTLGWNTFPIPRLTARDMEILAESAIAILLAREANFPKTIADLYDEEQMPDDLRRAHAANDEVLERIYIGRRFRNDTERLEKLFELYTKMTTKVAA